MSHTLHVPPPPSTPVIASHAALCLLLSCPLQPFISLTPFIPHSRRVESALRWRAIVFLSCFVAVRWWSLSPQSALIGCFQRFCVYNRHKRDTNYVQYQQRKIRELPDNLSDTTAPNKRAAKKTKNRTNNPNHIQTQILVPGATVVYRTPPGSRAVLSWI